MTASKPETESGDRGRAGSQTIWSGPAAVFRTRQVTAAPPAFKAGTSAAPIGPEAPLTRMRDGGMGYVSTLAERQVWGGRPRPPPLKLMLTLGNLAAGCLLCVGGFSSQVKRGGRGRPPHTGRTL